MVGRRPAWRGRGAPAHNSWPSQGLSTLMCTDTPRGGLGVFLHPYIHHINTLPVSKGEKEGEMTRNKGVKRREGGYDEDAGSKEHSEPAMIGLC